MRFFKTNQVKRSLFENPETEKRKTSKLSFLYFTPSTNPIEALKKNNPKKQGNPFTN